MLLISTPVSAHQLISCAATGESASLGWKCAMVVPTVQMAQMRNSVNRLIPVSQQEKHKLI